MIKGKYGYIKAKKLNLIKWLIIDVLFAIILFVIGLFINDFSNANVFTVFAMLFTIPGAKIVVSLVVISPFKGIDNGQYNKIKDKIGESENIVYDMVLTSTQNVMYLSAMIINKESYIILLANKKKQDIAFIKAYIGKHMTNYDFEKKVIVISDVNEFIETIDKCEFEDENINEIINKLMILQV